MEKNKKKKQRKLNICDKSLPYIFVLACAKIQAQIHSLLRLTCARCVCVCVCVCMCVCVCVCDLLDNVKYILEKFLKFTQSFIECMSIR